MRLYRHRKYRDAVYREAVLSDQELWGRLDTFWYPHTGPGADGRQALYLEWFSLPQELRRQGLGRRAYALWERRLDPKFQLIYLHAADTGAGETHGFWDAMGYSPIYCQETGNRAADQHMVKGIHGTPTPACISVMWEDE